MKAIFVLCAISLFVVGPLALQAQNAEGIKVRGLTNQDVINLVKDRVPSEQIVPIIRHTQSHFEMSLLGIEALQTAGVPRAIIGAMLNSRSATQKPNPPAPAPAKPADLPPPANIHPSPASPDATVPGAGQQPTPGSAVPSGSSPTPASSSRLQQAKSALIPPDSWVPPTKQPDPGCPITNHGKTSKIDVNYDTGSASTSRLGRSGNYCFAVRNVNPLYDWSVTLNVTEPTGNPFDLINDAIQTLTKLSTGASSAKPTPTPGPFAPVSCPDLTKVTQASSSLSQALSALSPTKDSSGKIPYIPLQKTSTDWATAQDSFSKFEQAVKSLSSSLPDTAVMSCDAVLLQAESIILDDYPKLRNQYKDLSTKMSQPNVVYYEQALESTASADLVVTPSYTGTSVGSKTFHFDPSFGILSSSAGFLLTELQARSYSSATAPDPHDPTKTQNVLKVDYGAGIRPALIVLLTGNIPYLNTRNYGLGVSAGPVFDISNGKADTSRFGFFGGASLRLTPWIYLTPGVHVGEFADFPPGFTHAGQVIPPNTGTPAATKRYTARFAFAITFKLKDLGSSAASAQPKSQQQGASPQQSSTGSKQ